MTTACAGLELIHTSFDDNERAARGGAALSMKTHCGYFAGNMRLLLRGEFVS